jgi:hypothetical protein
MSGGDSVTVGYKYRLTWHLIAALSGVTALRKLKSADYELWSGNVTSNSTITIDKPDLYGGDEQQGGFSGSVDIEFGADDQGVNSYLQDTLHPGGLVPAYRGLFGMVFKDCYYGTTGNLQPIAALATAQPSDWNTTGALIQAADAPWPDMNPAHMIRYMLTSTKAGNGYPPSMIDDASFSSASTKYTNENLGLSFFISDSRSVDEIIKEINRHTDSVLYQDPSDGLYKLVPLRDDYTIGDLIVLDDSNSELQSFARIGIDEMVNQMSISYHDVENDKNEIVTEQDLTQYNRVGKVVADKQDFLGISSKSLARAFAGREMAKRSFPLAKEKRKCNRQAITLKPGSVYKSSSARLGFSDLIMRVASVQHGTLKDPSITIEAIEDIFAYGHTVFSAGNVAGWSDPVTAAAPLTMQLAQEIPYWFYLSNMGGIPSGFVSGMGALLTIAGKATATDYDYQIQTKIGADAYAGDARGDFAATGLLLSSITAGGATVTLSSGHDLSSVGVGDVCIIENEWCVVEAVASPSFTLGRGCGDSVPMPHSAGTPVYFLIGYGTQIRDWTSGDTVDVKLWPKNITGQLTAGATSMAVAMCGRAEKPYPPAGIKLNGNMYPAAFCGTSVTVTWDERNRLTQTGDLYATDYGQIAPQAGQTVTFTAKDQFGAVITTASGITTRTATVTPVTETQTIEFLAKSVLDGIDSYQQQDFVADWAGFGLNFGKYFGGF